MRPEWEPEELVACWTLVDTDWELVANKAGATRLGFALLLKFFELEARFPRDRGELPRPPSTTSPSRSASRRLRSPGTTGRAVRSSTTVREALGFRESTVTDEQRWTRWLRDEVCPVELSEERVRDALLRRCRGDRIEPPGSSRIDRMLGAARAGHVAEFTARTVARLSDGANERLEQLVSEAADSAVGRRAGFLAELKADPGRVGLKTLLAEIEKLVSAPSGCRATCSRRRPSGSSRPGGHAPRSSIHRICAPLRVRSG